MHQPVDGAVGQYGEQVVREVAVDEDEGDLGANLIVDGGWSAVLPGSTP